MDLTFLAAVGCLIQAAPSLLAEVPLDRFHTAHLPTECRKIDPRFIIIITIIIIKIFMSPSALELLSYDVLFFGSLGCLVTNSPV